MRFASIAASALLSGFAASAALAAPAHIDSGSTSLADAVQAQPVATTGDEDPATCSKSRKRLWVEGDGWIVRRVTICR